VNFHMVSGFLVGLLVGIALCSIFVDTRPGHAFDYGPEGRWTDRHQYLWDDSRNALKQEQPSVPSTQYDTERPGQKRPC
jgi:hypothetical protein